MPQSIDWPRPSSPHRRRRFFIVVIVLGVIFFGSRSALSYYVNLLWFRSLGYGEVFWKTLSLQAGVFMHLRRLHLWFCMEVFVALKRAHLPDLPEGHTIFTWWTAAEAAGGTGAAADCAGAFAGHCGCNRRGADGRVADSGAVWYAPRTGGTLDPIFGRPVNFFLFTLPAWQLIVGWLLTLALITCALAGFFILITGGARALSGRLSRGVMLPWGGLSVAFSFLLLVIAMEVYLGRFERLLEDHTIFGGVTYTDAHVTLTGMLVVCAALIVGAAISAINAVRVPRGRWLVAAIIPAAVCYFGVQGIAWYVSSLS